MEHDSINFYQKSVRQLLSRYKSLTTEWSETELLFDDEQMHYMAVKVGWMKQKRIHLCLVHIDIQGDTVLIQCNNTEDLIATELAEMGIPRDKIHLGFVPPEVHGYPNTAEIHKDLK